MTVGVTISEENMKRSNLAYIHVECVLLIPSGANEYIVGYFSLEWGWYVGMEKNLDGAYS